VTPHTLSWREKSSAKCATVLLKWPPPDQLWKILAMSAMRLDERAPAEIPGTRPELSPPTAAAQTRIVSVARIRLDSRKSARPFKGIIFPDVSEIAVGTLITERPPHRTVRAQFGHTACMGLSLSRVHHAIFCRALLLHSFVRPAPRAFFHPDRTLPSPSRAAAVKDGASSAPPKACP
jgi:hypothetical protein